MTPPCRSSLALAALCFTIGYGCSSSPPPAVAPDDTTPPAAETEEIDPEIALIRERADWEEIKTECDRLYDEPENNVYQQERDLEAKLGLRGSGYDEEAPKPELELARALGGCGARQTKWTEDQAGRVEVAFDFHGAYSVACIFEAVAKTQRLLLVEGASFDLTNALGAGRMTLALATVETPAIDWGVEPVRLPEDASDDLINQQHSNRMTAAVIQRQCGDIKEKQLFVEGATELLERYSRWRKRAQASAELLAALGEPGIALGRLTLDGEQLSLSVAARTDADRKRLEGIAAEGGFARELAWQPATSKHVWPVTEDQLDWLGPQAADYPDNFRFWAAGADGDALLVEIGGTERPFVVRGGEPTLVTGRIEARRRPEAHQQLVKKFPELGAAHRFPKIRGKGRTVDLAFSRANARIVLRLLAVVGKTRITVPAGDDEVYVLARNVPWSGAADAIADAIGLRRKTKTKRGIRYEPVSRQLAEQATYLTFGGTNDDLPQPPPITWELLVGARLSAIVQKSKWEHRILLELTEGRLLTMSSRRHWNNEAGFGVTSVDGTVVQVELKDDAGSHRFEYRLTPSMR